ncbi:uncharacterized protein LOC142321165 [Lycorma delicatula]|uniref:uncharacterized protein LOC142321165 n=1 Tax=Lycorma delicatula TaxID=130591 RepID=UPI003F50EEF2
MIEKRIKKFISDHENEANHIKIEVPGQEQVLQTTGTAVNGHVQCIEQSTYTELISPLTQQNRSIGRPMMDIEKVTLDQINMWLNKVYPQRGEHFSEMMNTVDTMYNFAVEVDKLETVQIEPILDATGHINNSELNQVNYPAIKNVNSPNSSTSTSPQRRRLYRDVLSGDAENKFAQLEQEALEQYQASDHNIQTVPSEETLAQRYQDLEREALEQYRGDRDDWFTTPVTGEDKGGAGHLEEDPDPPITITPVVSSNQLFSSFNNFKY